MRVRTLAALLLVFLLLPRHSRGELWSFDQGAGTGLVHSRDTGDRKDLAILFLSPSHRGEEWEFALDLELRWNLAGGGFLSEEWDRRGDVLRPLKKAAWHPPGRGWSLALETFSGEEAGGGLVIGSLAGNCEIGYSVPGLAFRWKGEGGDLMVAGDRVVDPTLLAATAALRPFPWLSLVLEGAADPAAPLAGPASFSGGRPEEGAAGHLTGYGAEAAFILRRGPGFSLFALLSAASLGDASARGLGAAARLDFSPYYVSRLEILFRRLEGKEGYFPAYFDQPYQLERWGLPGQAPLLSQLRSGAGTDRVFDQVSLAYRLSGFLRAEGDYCLEEGEGPFRLLRVLVLLSEEGGRGIQASLWSRTLVPADRLLDMERLYSRISALFPLSPHLLARVNYQYSWAFEEAAGGLVPRTQWTGGLLYSITL